ncbi:unnamed protein product [Porites lobata]|uniref:Reverse transcriptase n=1 Tax=Porites lobata TaxID=104759 RepID=A0ABN8P0J3_9CNID|nr:unnamed protein product [Porites lobata]
MRVQEPLVQGLPALSILGDQLVKDLHAGKTLNTRQILDHVMDSIALLANANFKLNMARRELIKPELKGAIPFNPPYTRLCKDEIKPSTKLFGDDLSKHLEDMAEAKKVGRQMQKTSETRTASLGYFKAGRQKFRRPNFKPYDRPSCQKTSQQRPFLGYSRAQKSAQKKPSEPTNKTQSLGNICMGHIDDSFLLGYNYTACATNIQDTVDTFLSLGFVVHPEKSVLIPTQEMEFLGFLLNSINMTIRLLPVKAERRLGRPGYRAPSVLLQAYPADLSLCVSTCLAEYLERTKPLRGAESKLFY